MLDGGVNSEKPMWPYQNYLTNDEISILELLVGQYLDFAELQAKQRNPMTMKDWIEKLNSFLTLNDRDLRTDAGKVSAEMAKQSAEQEYEKFDTNRRLIEAEEADEDRQLLAELCS